MSDRPAPFKLGPDAVLRLLPHRRPLLMVDAVDAFEPAPRPSLRAHRQLALNDAVFEGHFPGRAIWPGVLIVEGLAQSCHLLAILAAAHRAVLAEGRDPGEPLPSLAAALVPSGIGLLAVIDVRFVEPVGAGQRLDYLVAEAALQPSATLARYEVDAQCEGRPVARGVLVVTRSPAP